MSKQVNIQDVDPDNLTADDMEYVAQRPWLKEQYERVTGNKWPDSENQDVDGMSADDTDDTGEGEDTQVNYNDWEYQALLDEVASRNEGRADDDKIVPASRKGDDLVAALEADDEASAE
jgi:hypothetical protein